MDGDAVFWLIMLFATLGLLGILIIITLTLRNIRKAIRGVGKKKGKEDE